MQTSKLSSNFFEDFEIGASIAHRSARTITDGDQALYVALTGDRFPLHTNAELARAVGLERETVNDLLVFHIVFGHTVPDVSINAIANLGYADVQFIRPVYPGDTLHTETKIVGKKENSNGRNGNLFVQSTGYNQHNQVVLQFYRWVMVHKRNFDSPAPEQVVPDLPPTAEISSDDTHPLSFHHFLASPHSGDHLWEDYEVGETIFHDAGMTIEESEHAMATRLYHNTAKVHLDTKMMATTPHGKRLIYGGHIISIARALSYNGLENAVKIMAWNAGSHTNPTYAGDTLYAFSKIIDISDHPNIANAGLVRIQLIATKNEQPKDNEFQIKFKKDGRDRYNPHVVLDLDYTVLIPKREYTT
jgi:2-methylfumaryl-CoA hydratase